jgi:uncharacterized membrane protein
MRDTAGRNEELAHQLLGCSYADLNQVQRSVIDLIAVERPTGVDPAMVVDDRSRGEWLADRVAAIGGSWTFILSFGIGLAIWMVWNWLGRGRGIAFDPFPFIFLNLVLSMLAALQAPVIMMSQNRSAARDREAAEHDYIVNLRAELEIMHLHDKIDALRAGEFLQLLKAQGEALSRVQQQLAMLVEDQPARRPRTDR